MEVYSTGVTGTFLPGGTYTTGRPLSSRKMLFHRGLGAKTHKQGNPSAPYDSPRASKRVRHRQWGDDAHLYSPQTSECVIGDLGGTSV